MMTVFFFKQKSANDVRISDWSSDVCSSDLGRARSLHLRLHGNRTPRGGHGRHPRRRVTTGPPMLASLLASIPSPPGKSIGIGPFQLRAYGLAIAVGALAAVWIAPRRYARRGGDPADLAAIAQGAVPRGLVGAPPYPRRPHP